MGASFGEVDNVKFDCHGERDEIFNTEEKPLVMTSCVGVDSHIEIIFIIISLYNHVKIARFKFTVKLECVFNFRVHSLVFSRLFYTFWRRSIGIRGWKLKFVLPFLWSRERSMQMMCICRPKSIINNLWA